MHQTLKMNEYKIYGGKLTEISSFEGLSVPAVSSERNENGN